MIHRKTTYRYSVLTAASLLAIVVVGCTNERFEEASISRWENIGAVNRAVYAREQESPQRLKRISDIISATEPHHEKRLAYTLELLRSKQQAELDRWPTRWARTRDDYRNRMAGNPDFIPDAVARMWY